MNEIKEVQEVEEVLVVVEKCLATKQDLPYEVFKQYYHQMNMIKEEYNKTVKDLLISSSLNVKLERLLELIGAISTISVEDEERADNIISLLSIYIDSQN